MLKLLFTPKALGLVWSVGFKALLLVLVIIGLVALVAWLVTELIWRKREESESSDETDIDE